MATARATQAHQKRVQKIVEEAAEQIAADSPIEEEVVVTVEELPPDDAAAPGEPGAEDVTGEVLISAARTQQAAARGFNAWMDDAKHGFGTGQLADLVDPRLMVENTFRFAQQWLALQKDLALKFVDALPVGR